MPNAIVTGANRGIGLQLCHALKDRGYTVTALCRQRSDALAGMGINIHDQITPAFCAVRRSTIWIWNRHANNSRSMHWVRYV